MAPSAPPAPTRVCNSSMKRIVFLARRTSFITALMRSSNWPRYFVPATIIARSSTTMRRSASSSGTSPLTTRCAKPSTMAVLPTPASPSSTGLFFVRRLRICIVRSISFSRPMTGSSLPCRASSVRSRPKLSRAGVFDLPARGDRLGPAGRPRRRRPCRRPARSLRPSMPWPRRFSTSSRTSSSFRPRFISTCAATPSCSRKQAQQDVLGADVVMAQVAGLFHRVLDDLLGPRRLRQLAHGDHVGAALHELLHLQADLAEVDVQVLQHVGGHAAAFLDQAQQDVLGADVFVVEPLGLLVGQLHDLACAVGESSRTFSYLL